MSAEPSSGWTEVLGEHATNPPAPRRSGEVIFALGKEWTVSSCENRIKAQFEQWVRRNAQRELALLEKEMHPDEIRQYKSAYLADRASGRYDWPEGQTINVAGSAIRSAMHDVPGTVYLLYLLLVRCDPEVTLDLATQIFKDNPQNCGNAIGWALGNGQAPETAKNGADQKNKIPTQTLD